MLCVFWAHSFPIISLLEANKVDSIPWFQRWHKTQTEAKKTMPRIYQYSAAFSELQSQQNAEDSELFADIFAIMW